MGFGSWKQWRFVTMVTSHLDGRTQLQLLAYTVYFYTN